MRTDTSCQGACASVHCGHGAPQRHWATVCHFAGGRGARAACTAPAAVAAYALVRGVQKRHARLVSSRCLGPGRQVPGAVSACVHLGLIEAS